jgi:hypothetical protein
VRILWVSWGFNIGTDQSTFMNMVFTHLIQSISPYYQHTLC